MPQLLMAVSTLRMTVLDNLYAGVGYNCSIRARNSAGLSDPVYTDDTTTEIGRFVHHYGFTSQLYEKA